jgi:hypothetical protein
MIAILPFAHIGGVPIEETLGFGPALLIALGAVAANLRARFLRMPAASHGSREEGEPAARL